MKLKRKIKSVVSIVVALSMVMTLFAGLTFAADVDVTAEGDYYTFDGLIGTFTSGGTEDYHYVASAIIIGDEVYTNLANVDADSAVDVVIDDSESGHEGIIIVDAGEYTISNATITMFTDADGSDTCDFSGTGSAIAVYGDSNVTIEDSYVDVSGVATMPIFCDDGATVTVISSTLISRGGTLYADYMNSPDQAAMVAPPWILGIMGTSRCTNLMGIDSTMNFIDSVTAAGAWAVLSTDSGSNMYLNIYNTSLTLLNADESAAAPLQEDGGEISATNDNPYSVNYGSGYGTYAIGDAVETFAGATVNVGTYATIFTGGSAVYTSLTAGETYTLASADGETDVEYTATEDAVTVINSDTFGFMVHQSANTITIEEGTIVNSGYATFLIKSGGGGTVTATIDDAEINNGGVLIQVLDNDDSTNGGMMSADDELNTNGGSMNFIPYHTENAGFNTENTSTVQSGTQSFTFTNGDYTGNIYNGSGSDNSDNGPLSATVLEVTLGEGATLTGAAASTSFIHVTYEGSQIVLANGGDAYDTVEEAAEILAEQNTYFTIDEYYSIGQVANLINYNGYNDINITLTDDAVWYVDGTSVITSLTISGDAQVVVLDGATLTVGDTTYEAGTVLTSGITTDGTYYYYDSWIGSWTSGGDEDNDYVATAIIMNGVVYTSDSTITADSAVGTVIDDSESGHNGFVIVDTDYTISNATITMLTDADGSDTCDFSGVGSAIAVYGDSYVLIEDSYIETAGVATMPVFTDSGATVTVKNSTLISRGGTLYASYMNSPDQAVMVAPPWILGIMGTSRTTNLMGNDSTMNFIDSDTSSGAWAVLSTDSGSNMYLNVYNTSLTLLNGDESAAAPLQEEGGEISETIDNPYTTNYGSGYGTYAIGDAVETFAGATINVGTYATIFTGGSAVYTSLTAGETYTLASADGENDITYTATEDAVTVINSDTFGFMVHQSANTITIEEGTIVNSGYATFLIKSGGGGTVTATIDDAEITNGGVLIQVMDNDDSTNGGMMGTDDELNTNGGSMNFIPYHTENEGFNTENTSTVASGTQSFTFTNGDYTGNIYNGSGSDNSNNGPLSATTLEVTIGEGATLTGAVASTSFIHVTYEGSELVKANGGYAYDTIEEAAEILAYQNTYFTIDNYYDIGQVANLVNYNGYNDIYVTLTDDAVWTVTGTSVVTSLAIADSAYVVVTEDASLTVDGVEYGAGTYTSEDFAADADEAITGISDITIAVGETYQLTPSINLAAADDAADDTAADDAAVEGGMEMGEMPEGEMPDDIPTDDAVSEDTVEDTADDAAADEIPDADAVVDDTEVSDDAAADDDAVTDSTTSEVNPDVADDGTGGEVSSEMIGSAEISDGILTITANGQEMDSFSYTVTAAGETIASGTIAGGDTTTVDVSGVTGEITISASSSTPGPYEGQSQEITVIAEAAASAVVALSKDFDAYQQYLEDFVDAFGGSDEDLITAIWEMAEDSYTATEVYIYLTSNSGAGRDFGVYAYDYDTFALQGYNWTYYNAYDADADEIVEDDAVVEDTEDTAAEGTFVYTSADESVAAVSESGLVTGIAAGQTTITVDYVVDGEIVATRDITVTVTDESAAEAPAAPDATIGGGDDTTAEGGDDTTAEGGDDTTAEGGDDTTVEDGSDAAADDDAAADADDTDDTTAADSDDTASPTTSDSTNMALWMSLAALAILGLALASLKRRFN